MNQADVIVGPRIEVRKSIFVGTVVKITSADAARAFVKDMKRRDRKACHVAFAFRVGTNPVVEGMSDDGEPRGTAGVPLLMLLRNRKINDTLVAVTRVWGGTKLGTGNLRRAYTQAAIRALEAT